MSDARAVVHDKHALCPQFGPIVLIDPSGLSGERDTEARFNERGSSDRENESFLSNLFEESVEELITNGLGYLAYRTYGTNFRVVSSRLGLIFNIGSDVYTNIRDGRRRQENAATIGARIAIDVTARLLIFGFTGVVASANPVGGIIVGIGLNAFYDTYRGSIQNSIINYSRRNF